MVNGEIKINIDIFFNNEILARRAFGVFESCLLFEPKSWFPENQETLKQRVDFPLPFHKIRYLSNHAVLKRFNELFLSFLRTFSTPTPCFVRSSPQCVKHLRLSFLFCARIMPSAVGFRYDLFTDTISAGSREMLVLSNMLLFISGVPGFSTG